MARSLRHAPLLVPLLAAFAASAAGEACRLGKPCDSAYWALCRGGGELAAALRSEPGEAAATRRLAPVLIRATRAERDEQQRYRLSGGVRLERADQRLATEALLFESLGGRFASEGPLAYLDRNLAAESARAEGVLGEERASLEQVRYELVRTRGSGSAARIRREPGEVSVLERVSFSTCDLEDRRWEFEAAEIRLDHAAGWGEGRDLRLRVGGLPILWAPYWRFPLDDRRRSGFLTPVIGSSSNTGIDLTIPYYLNLAPNYDATAALRLIGGRGTMFAGEARYLTRREQGEVELALLPDDNEFGARRWSWRLAHHGRYGAGWLLDARLGRVSDRSYLEDFGDSVTRTATRLLYSRAALSRRLGRFTAELSADAWQVTDPLFPPGAEPYARRPRLLLAGRQPLPGGLEFGLSAEAVAFRRDDALEGERLDAQATLSLNAERAFGHLRPALGWRHTAYRLDRPEARRPSRTLPILSLDAGLVFERDASLRGRPFLHTLEPRLHYLYVPFREQGALPVFDTGQPAFSVAQLFRSNRFVGADRQGDADQLAWLLTQRLIDDGGSERLALSLGQIRYRRPPRVTLPGEPPPGPARSPWIAELELALDRNWRLALAEHWDPERDRAEFLSARIEYRTEAARAGRGGLVGALSYRFRRDYLEQYDFSLLVPLAEGWRGFARWNYSRRDRQTLEALAGFEFETCCTAWRVLARRYLRNVQGDFNNGLWLELELKGLGSLGRKAAPLLERAILGYGSRPWD
ncbi:MAG: LPS assembly protein LptD [Xanthomonadales bacterium]|nr:LPS assembly protein LptD [Xanthomonadales bacterium]